MNEADRHGTRDSERDPTDWVGRERVEHDILTLFPARGMAALLDRSPKEMGDGSVLPPGWHWLYFRPVVEQRHLGGDGHERLGDFLRPVPLSRRMWAGGKLSLLDELRLGDAVTRRSRVESAVEKQGRSGRLFFVTVRHDLSTERGPAVEEVQHLVYRGGVVARRPPGAPVVPSECDWSERFSFDTVTLFRFSALTFNGHRIHYDHPYAVGVEGYPELVVHAPLTALLLLDAAMRHAAARVPTGYEYRATSPLFAGEEIRIAGSDPRPDDGPTPEESEAWAAAPDGALAMRTRTIWRER